MSVQNPKNLIKRLVGLISVASVSIALNSPALALINSSGLNKSFNNGTLQTDSTGQSRQLLAQNPSSPSPGQVSPGSAPTNGGASTTPGINGGTTTTPGTTPGVNGGTTTTPGTTPGVNGGTTTTPGITPGVNDGTTTTPGTTPGVNGGTTTTPGVNGGTTNGGNNSGTGQSTNGANNRRNGQSTDRSTSGSGRSNSSQRSAYTQYMKAGYAATQQKNYQTALTNFKKALSLRPGDRYATQAIQNVQGYIQRGSR